MSAQLLDTKIPTVCQMPGCENEMLDEDEFIIPTEENKHIKISACATCSLKINSPELRFYWMN